MNQNLYTLNVIFSRYILNYLTAKFFLSHKNVNKITFCTELMIHGVVKVGEELERNIRGCSLHQGLTNTLHLPTNTYTLYIMHILLFFPTMLPISIILSLSLHIRHSLP